MLDDLLQPDALSGLRSCLTPDRVAVDELKRHSMASDASHFLMLPAAVLTPSTAEEVARLMGVCARHRVPLTFRSGGTSLSG